MAVINRNSLVLDNVSVVRGVVTGTWGMGFESASGKTAAIPFSMRPPSHPYPQAGQKTSPRQDRADRSGAVAAANRAGRSESTGVRASGNPPWSEAMGGTGSTAAWRLRRFTAKHPASVGNELLRGHRASRDLALGNGNAIRLPVACRARRHAGLARRTGGAFPPSARGIGF